MSLFSVNKLILVGGVTQKPVLNEAPSGNRVCKINIATSESRKNKETDQWDEVSTFHRVTGWNTIANLMAMAEIGDIVYCEAKVTYSEAEQEDGTKKYYTNILADKFIVSARKKKAKAADEPPEEPSLDDFEDNPQTKAKKKAAVADDGSATPEEEAAPSNNQYVNPDDIPF